MPGTTGLLEEEPLTWASAARQAEVEMQLNYRSTTDGMGGRDDLHQGRACRASSM